MQLPLARPSAPAAAHVGPGVFVACVFAAVLTACGPSDFDPASLIESVRILASRSDHPYAPPGATVRSEMLAVDERPDATTNEPMQLYWLPFVCVNPPNDAYYACFSEFESASAHVAQAGLGVDGGGAASISGNISTWDGGLDASVAPALGFGALLGSGSLKSIPTGVDISAYLIKGPRAAFQLPTDIVSSHAPVKGAMPYGLAVVFNIACAGHVEIVALDPNNPAPEQIPLGCFNAKHEPLTANDYVIGYTEVFSFDTITNANPVIDSFTFRGKTVPVRVNALPGDTRDGGPRDGSVDSSVTFPHCTEANTNNCPDNIAKVFVPDASWERDPQNLAADGGPLGEQIWVDYYTTQGSVRDDAILIFDPAAGRVKAPKEEDLQDITAKERGTLWAVVHDNRGGAAWITVPYHAD